jgi:hypothetical protein
VGHLFHFFGPITLDVSFLPRTAREERRGEETEDSWHLAHLLRSRRPPPTYPKSKPRQAINRRRRDEKSNKNSKKKVAPPRNKQSRLNSSSLRSAAPGAPRLSLSLLPRFSWSPSTPLQISPPYISNKQDHFLRIIRGIILVFKRARPPHFCLSVDADEPG